MNNSKPSLLVCIPAAAFPARLTGMSVRYAPILSYLSQWYDIDLIQILGSFSAPMTEQEIECPLRSYHCVARDSMPRGLAKRIWRKLARLSSIGNPDFAMNPDAKSVSAQLKKLLDGKRYDVALWVSSFFASDGVANVRSHSNRTVLDMIDSPYSYASKLPNIGRWGRWKLKRIMDWERRMIREVDCTMYISRADLGSICSANESARNGQVITMPNGVLDTDYSPRVANVPGIAPDDFVIGFLGNMSYIPNIVAVSRLKHLVDRLDAKAQLTKTLIIGRDPDVQIQRLASDSSIHLTGTVEDIWPFINRVDLFVFPMAQGAGQQNKVLEAMRAGKAVVCTSVANAGIGAGHGEHVIVADSDKALLDAIELLRSDRSMANRIAAAGQQFVHENYSWPALLPRFRSALAGTLDVPPARPS